MVWTISIAGENLDDVERRGGEWFGGEELNVLGCV